MVFPNPPHEAKRLSGNKKVMPRVGGISIISFATTLFFPAVENQKTDVNKQNCRNPRKRKRMIQHGNCTVFLKYRAYPNNSECAGSDHCTDGRIHGVSAAAHSACRNLIQIADRFKKQNAQDSHSCALNHSRFRRKKTGKKSRNKTMVKIRTELQTVDRPRQSQNTFLHLACCPAA